MKNKTDKELERIMESANVSFEIRKAASDEWHERQEESARKQAALRWVEELKATY